MSQGVWALLVAVPVALVIGLVWRARQGAVRRSGSEVAVSQFPEELRQQLPEPGAARVTLLQLSTTFCAPCRHTQILLDDYAKRTEGVRHVEVDLTDHPEWSTPLRVHTTPTTLVLDSAGEELFRVGGVPKPRALTEALGPYLN
jgi:thiol-disulfide isomerase/thioredoxin